MPPKNLPNNQRNAPEPVALQPAKYDLDTMAEHFLVKDNVGGAAYIGGYTGVQPWSWDLLTYFFDEFTSNKTPSSLIGMNSISVPSKST